MAVKKLYFQLLQHIENLLGTDEADTDELERVGWLLWPQKFNGVFAKDESFNSENGYAIVNTDPISKSGEHWLAVADGKLYDSFARKDATQLIDRPNLEVSGDPYPEQQVQEKNCGQRCLAWLATYDTVGPERINLL
jgi:hypothetical protein